MDRFQKFSVYLLIILSIAIGFEIYHARAIPAPSTNSTCEPGGCGSGLPCTFSDYIDGSSYLATKCLGGGNSYKETSFSTLWADMTTDSACSSGCSIFIHAGTYRPTANMLMISNLRIWGEGAASIIRANNLASSSKVTFPGASGSSVGALFYGTGLSNIWFSDLSLAGDDNPAASEDSTTQTFGPVCFGCTGLNFKNVLWKDFNTSAMNLALDGSNNPTTNVTIINSIVQARTVAGVQYAGDGWGLEASREVLITGNLMLCVDDCIVFATQQPGGQSSQAVNLQDFTITGNFIQSKAHPLAFQAWSNTIFKNIAIANNVLLSRGSAAIGIDEVSSANPPSKNIHIAITGNILDGSWNSGSIAGVLLSNSYQVSITGNTFRQWGIQSIRLNYAQAPSTGQITNEVLISDNNFDGANLSNVATGSFIYVDASGSQTYLISVKNNIFQVAGNEKYFIDFSKANVGGNNQLLDVQGNIFSGTPVSGVFNLPIFGNGFVTVSGSNSFSGTNPLGKLATPFGGASLGLQGTAAAPTASTTYTVRTANIFNFTSIGGTGVVLTIKDQAGNCIVCGAATATGVFVPLYGTVNYGAFSVAPTETIYIG